MPESDSPQIRRDRVTALIAASLICLVLPVAVLLVYDVVGEGRSRREILARGRNLRVFRGEGVRRDDLTRDAALEFARALPEPTFRSRGPWCDLDAWEDRQGGGGDPGR